MTVSHDKLPGFPYGATAMRKLPRETEHTGSSALIRSPEPTTRQLAVLDAYAAAGSYQLAAATTGISPALVRNVLIEIREQYCAATTIQAYRAALASGDLAAPRESRGPGASGRHMATGSNPRGAAPPGERPTA
jgi:hypothetical protein